MLQRPGRLACRSTGVAAPADRAGFAEVMDGQVKALHPCAPTTNELTELANAPPARFTPLIRNWR